MNLRSRLRAVFLSIIAIAAAIAPNSYADLPLTIGIGTHFGQDRYDVDISVRRIRDLGLNHIRDEIYWSHIERRSGQFREPGFVLRYLKALRENDLQMLLVLGYGNKLHGEGRKPRTQDELTAFSRYVEFVVTQHRDQLSTYEIWNEWQGRVGGDLPGTPAEYLALLDSVVPVIRKADSEARIVGGSVTPEGIKAGWLDEFVAGGGLGRIDILSIHPYFHSERDADPERWHAWISSVLAKVNQKTRRTTEVMFTEMGWPGASGKRRFPEQLRAAYAARIVLLSATIPGVKGLWWYELRDGGRDQTRREQSFGVLDYDYEPKESFSALKASASLVRNATAVRRLAVSKAPELMAFEFSKDDRNCVALWALSGSQRVSVQAAIQIPSDGSILPVLTRSSQPQTQFEIDIGATPSYVCGAISASLKSVRSH